MKYLKKFNEELKPTTYFSAARKLKKIGHSGRAEDLQKWGEKMQDKENLVKWKDTLQDYAPFGIFKINIENDETKKEVTGDFALFLQFDELAFEDNYEYEKSQDPNNIKDISILFFIGLIPTSEELKNECDQVVPEPEFDNGFYWGMCFSIEFEVVNGDLKIKGYNFDDYDSGMTGMVSFADRASAGKFKMLLKSIFSNPNLGYPSSYTDEPDMYKKMEQVILIRQSFSSDYGFELSQVAEFINTISPNLLYQS